MDLPLNGATFTCTNNQESPSLYKLDRFQLSALEGIGGGAFFVLQEALLKPILDHIPILLAKRVRGEV